jgi:hypothetical protein
MAARPGPLRLALGFAVAPLVVPLAWIALIAALGELPDFSDPASDRCAGLAMDLAITLGIGYALTLLLGLPLVLVLRRTGLLAVAWTLAGGSLAGAAGTAAVLLSLGTFFRSPWVLALAPGGAGCGFGVGGVVAGIFCAVAGVPLRRPRLPAPGATPAAPASPA